jgi:antitoxin (DNA-binding transcriptional repressor) of toxin-antitoxin stability system
MTKIDTLQLHSELPRLVECLGRGERVLLTDGGHPIGIVVPPEIDQVTDTQKLVRDMLTWRELYGPTLGNGLTNRKLVEEGRKR